MAIMVILHSYRDMILLQNNCLVKYLRFSLNDKRPLCVVNDQVSLARHRFAEVDYEGACSHFEQALAVKPLLPAAWFTLGVARMRLGRWSESLEAFSRVAQQEPEEGEVRLALAFLSAILILWAVVYCYELRYTRERHASPVDRVFVS